MAGVDFLWMGRLSEDAFDALQTVTENQMVKIFGSKYLLFYRYRVII